MSAANRSNRPSMFAWSCAPAFILAALAAAFGCLMAAASPASAEVRPSDLAGRWVTYVADPKVPCTHPACRLAYDLVPCGEGWCGIEVKEDKSCGRTAMRLDAGAPAQSGVTFSGRYERAESTQPYTVRAHLYPTPRPAARHAGAAVPARARHHRRRLPALPPHLPAADAAQPRRRRRLPGPTQGVLG